MKQRKNVIRRRMREIEADARQRRAELLADYNKAKAEMPELSKAEYGDRIGLTGERVGQMIKKALEDINKAQKQNA